MKLLSLYLFALLAATANSLTCLQSGTSQPCDKAKCYSQRADSTIGGSKGIYTEQQCTASCETFQLSFTYGNKQYFRAATTCCDRSDCNTPPTVPSGDLPSSTLVCPTCFAFGSTYCKATLMKCPDAESKCVNVTGTFSDASGRKSFYSRACSTSVTQTNFLNYRINTSAESWVEINSINEVKPAEKSLTCHNSSKETQLCTDAECYSQQAESTVGGSKTPHDIFTCLSSCKARNIKFTFGDKKYIRANGECCTKDSCNTPLKVSDADVKNSSLECPGCFEFKTYCEATLMKCPEKEDQCVNITGTFVDGSKRTPFYGRGCTAVTERDIVLGDTIATGENSWFQISGISTEKAKDSSWSVQESSTVTLLLSGLIGIQLTNFFY